MAIQLMLAISVLGCCLFTEAHIAISFNATKCDTIPEGTDRWKATINTSKPIHLDHVSVGDVTYTRIDGRYFELTGMLESSNRNVCVSIHGDYILLSWGFDVTINIKPILPSEVVTPQEIRTLRVRRATEIWHVSSFPVSNDATTILKSLEPYHNLWGQDSLSSTTRHSSVGAITVHYAKGTYSQSSGGHKGVGWFITPNQLGSNNDDLILTYDIYFEDFGWGKMGKIPGLFGGVSGDGAYGCGGGNHPTTCYSLRLMWRAGGDGELYAYLPPNQAPGFASRPDVIVNYEYGHSIGRGKIKFQNGVWQTVTEQVHLNTVGKTDGWVKICNQVHGQDQQCYTASNLNMRNVASYHNRGIFFTTFFGGSDPSDAAPSDCNTYFKELHLQIPEGTVVG